jgi:hypothetical protein
MIQLDHKFDEHDRLVVSLRPETAEEDKAKLREKIALLKSYQSLGDPDFNYPNDFLRWSFVSVDGLGGGFITSRKSWQGIWFTYFTPYAPPRFIYPIDGWLEIECDTAEWLSCNSEFQYDLDPPSFDIRGYPEEGGEERVVETYWFSAYALRSWVEDLVEKGEAVFDKVNIP